MTVSGKCLVVINDHRAQCPDIHVFVQSANGGQYAADSLSEDVNTHLFLNLEGILSKRQMTLPEGTTIRLAINCSVNYYHSYEGEWDSDLEVHKVRTLREQLPSSKLRRKWKLFDKQQAKKSVFEDIKAIDAAYGRVDLRKVFS